MSQSRYHDDVQKVISVDAIENSNVLQHLFLQPDSEYQLSEDERIEQLRHEIELYDVSVEKQEQKIKKEFGGINENNSKVIGELPTVATIGGISFEDKDFQKIVDERMSIFLKQNPEELLIEPPMTTEQFYLKLEELEERQKEFEEQGLYMEAQQVMNQIKELNLVEGRKVEQQYHKNKRRAYQELRQKHSIEQQAFEEIWDGKLEEYDKQAKEVILATLDRQKWEKKETDKHLRSQLLAQKPKFSKNLLNMKVQLEKVVKQKMYNEAEEIRKNIESRELQELRLFEQEQEAKIQQKMKIVAQKHAQEIEALKQRIQKGKSELAAQKRVDKSRLDQQHANAWLEFETKQKKLLARAKDYINKQSSVVLNSSRNHAVDYSHLQGLHREMSISSTPSPSSSRSSSSLRQNNGTAHLFAKHAARSDRALTASEKILDNNKKKGSMTRMTKKISLLK